MWAPLYSGIENQAPPAVQLVASAALPTLQLAKVHMRSETRWES